LIDPDADLVEGDRYFEDAPGLVAFLDYHHTPNSRWADGNDYIYLDYTNVRRDYRSQGLARRLFDEMFRKYGKNALYDFGKIMNPAIYKMHRQWQRRGLNVTGKNWDGYTDEEVGLKSAARRVAARYSRAASAGHLKVEEYYGKKGRKDHITRYEKGTIPTKEALKLNPPIRYHGRRKWHMRDGERYFGNYSEERWNALLEDIRKNGIKTDLWIQADPGKEAELMEGNHRVQAAAQVGLPTVPVYIRYYGLREEDGLVAPQVRRTTIHQDEERRR